MMSENDMVLIAHLRSNSRETLTKMSKLTGIPVSTVYDRLKQYKKGFIQKNTCVLDFGKLGFSTRVNVLVKVEREAREQVKDFLVKDFNINSVYKINSGFDFMFEGVFRHVKDVEDFLEKFEDRFSIEQKQVFYIIEDIKREGFLSDPETAELLLK